MESFLETDCTASVKDNLYRAIISIDINEEKMVKYLSALSENYKYVDEIFELQKGKFVRWLVLETQNLVHGGIVLDIEPSTTGSMLITCKNYHGQIFRYDFNNALTFQKLTSLEKTILSLNSSINYTTENI
jgi:hypothetical protein